MKNPRSSRNCAVIGTFHHQAERAISIMGRNNPGAGERTRFHEHRPSTGDQILFEINLRSDWLEVEVIYAELYLVIPRLRNGRSVPRCQHCIGNGSSTTIGKSDAGSLPAVERIYAAPLDTEVLDAGAFRSSKNRNSCARFKRWHKDLRCSGRRAGNLQEIYREL